MSGSADATAFDKGDCSDHRSPIIHATALRTANLVPFLAAATLVIAIHLFNRSKIGTSQLRSRGDGYFSPSAASLKVLIPFVLMPLIII